MSEALSWIAVVWFAIAVIENHARVNEPPEYWLLGAAVILLTAIRYELKYITREETDDGGTEG